jgi:hypothetical protein
MALLVVDEEPVRLDVALSDAPELARQLVITVLLSSGRSLSNSLTTKRIFPQS